MIAGPLGRLHRRLAAALDRHPRRTDGGVVATAENDDGPDGVDHLRDVPDGAGCTEIWEHLSDRRDEEDGNGGD